MRGNFGYSLSIRVGEGYRHSRTARPTAARICAVLRGILAWLVPALILIFVNGSG